MAWLKERAIREKTGEVIVAHSPRFLLRRFANWFPLGLMYAFLYWGRYNLTVAKSAFGDLMSNSDFGIIFGAGTVCYAISFLITGPLTDRIGGKKMIIFAAGGSAVMNALMGVVTYSVLTGGALTKSSLMPFFIALYILNMCCQSCGAVAIVKVNAHWFHVRERGGFGGIFGTMIATGLFFAFQVSGWVLAGARGAGPNGMDAKWWVFFAPAIALAAMVVIGFVLLRDKPSQAGYADFDTADASSGEDDKPVPAFQVLKKILTNPVIFTIACIEFCTGVLRNGTMHWVDIYIKAPSGLHLAREHFLRSNWGLILMAAGIIGGNVAGWVSDKFFQSRRAPAAGGLYAVMFLASIAMCFTYRSALYLGITAFILQISVIGIHGLFSGTASQDFGGRKAAATATGLIDGFVYLGTGFQSICLGNLTTLGWAYWPPFLIPFTLIGFALCLKIWNALPKRATGAH